MNEQDMQIAKDKAIAFLEKSIFTLSLVFGVDPKSLNSQSQNIFEPGEIPYDSYKCLLHEVASLEKLTTGEKNNA